MNHKEQFEKAADDLSKACNEFETYVKAFTDALKMLQVKHATSAVKDLNNQHKHLN